MDNQNKRGMEDLECGPVPIGHVFTVLATSAVVVTTEADALFSKIGQNGVDGSSQEWVDGGGRVGLEGGGDFVGQTGRQTDT